MNEFEINDKREPKELKSISFSTRAISEAFTR